MEEDRIVIARQQLIIDDLSTISPNFHKILSFDPTPVYDLLGDRVNPYMRNNRISFPEMFPSPEEGLCTCGCGRKLEGRRTRWATDNCSDFSAQIHSIITGKADFIRLVLYQIYEDKCHDCGKTSMQLDRPNEKDWRTPIELEHVLPVKHGGGGCWLSNYRFRCFICHRKKTNNDFGWKKK